MMKRDRSACAVVAAAALVLLGAVDPGPASTPAPAAGATPAPAATPGPPTTPPVTQPEGAAPKEPDLRGRIRGTVRGPGKKAAAGILVQLTARDGSALLRVTGTDTSGQYLFQDLPAGTYDLEAGGGAMGRQQKGSVVVRPPFQNVVDFDLAPAAAPGSAAAPIPPPGDAIPAGPPGEGAAPSAVPVRGILVGTDRQPVTEALVTLVSHRDGSARQAFSSDDGRFVIEGVPAGLYRVLVASPGHVALDLRSVEVAPAAGLNLDLTLVDFPLQIRGRREAPPKEVPHPAPAPTAATTPAPPAARSPAPSAQEAPPGR